MPIVDEGEHLGSQASIVHVPDEVDVAISVDIASCDDVSVDPKMGGSTTR